MGESARPRAVVFDVDGTLVDSERNGHRVAFNQAFADAGLPFRWDEVGYGRLLETAGGQARLRQFLRDEGYDDAAAAATATALHRRKTEVFRDLCVEGRIPPRPGVVRLLDELQATGVTLAVATTGTRAWVEPLLARTFGLQRFASVLTGTEIAELKPAPDVYTATLSRLALPAADVLAVEDSANGLEAALAAGLRCLVVVNDYTAAQDFSGAAAVVDGFGHPGTARLLSGPDVLDDGAVVPTRLARLFDGR